MIYYAAFSRFGEVAQLVEHHVRNVGVGSSNLLFSTKFRPPAKENSVKGFIATCIAVGVAAFLSGCFSIDRADLMRTGEEHVLVSNYGWYLFGIIPLCGGNADVDAWTPWVLFRNDVTMDKIQNRFMQYKTANGHENVRDLVYNNYESVMFEFPGLGLPVPIPYVLTFKEIQLSGVMK